MKLLWPFALDSRRTFLAITSVVVLLATGALCLCLWARPRPFIDASMQCETQRTDIDKATIGALVAEDEERLRILNTLESAQLNELGAATDIVGIRESRSFPKSKSEDMVSIDALGKRSAFARDFISRAMIKFAASYNEVQTLSSELGVANVTPAMGSSETNYNDIAFYVMVGRARDFVGNFDKLQSNLNHERDLTREVLGADLSRLQNVQAHSLDLTLFELRFPDYAPMSPSGYKRAFELTTIPCGRGTLRYTLAKHLSEWCIDYWCWNALRPLHEAFCLRGWPSPSVVTLGKSKTGSAKKSAYRVASCSVYG
jgi:hypothetical protein